jgi:hypothetical protein
LARAAGERVDTQPLGGAWEATPAKDIFVFYNQTYLLRKQ